MPWLWRKHRSGVIRGCPTKAATSICGSVRWMGSRFLSKDSNRYGNDADNPWLQEVPDPVTKVVWDHYATMNPADMEARGLNTMMVSKKRLERYASM